MPANYQAIIIFGGDDSDDNNYNSDSSVTSPSGNYAGSSENSNWYHCAISTQEYDEPTVTTQWSYFAMENSSYNASGYSGYSWQQSDDDDDHDSSDTGYNYGSVSSGYGEHYSNTRRWQDSDALTHDSSAYDTTYDGSICLPFTLETPKGTVTVHSLGVVYTREGFATARNIFPVGYCSSVRFIDYREYFAYGSQSYIDYYSKIADEEGELTFEIYVGDDTYPTFTGSSASKVWGELSVKLTECQHSGLTNVSGLLMMGLNDPRIIRAIQELPGAEDSPEYQMQEITY